MDDTTIDLTLSDDESERWGTKKSLRRRLSDLSLQGDDLVLHKRLKYSDAENETTNSNNLAILIENDGTEKDSTAITTTHDFSPRRPQLLSPADACDAEQSSAGTSGAQQISPLSPTAANGQIFYVSDDEEEPDDDDDDNNIGAIDLGISPEAEELRVVHSLDDHKTPAPDVEILRASSTSPRKTFACTPGKVIEFHDGSFMRIKSVEEDQHKQTILVGQLFVRQNSFGARVEKRRNEVVWILDGPQVPGQGTLTRRVLKEEKIVRYRKLIMTNYIYPYDDQHEHHPRNHPDSWRDPAQDRNFGVLFCRIKHYSVMKNKKIVEELWAALSEHEADPDHQMSDLTKRIMWRDLATVGGSHEETVSVFDDSGQFHDRIVVQKYTFGDAFCGGGGVSCGAKKAGLHTKWSFDIESKAVRTYELNFPQTKCHNKAVHDFILYARRFPKRTLVDILHLSPPCQPFSPAHTINGRNDEANEACLLSVGTTLQAVKPRVVTLEQTWGLVNRNPQWFHALIHDFLRNNYSIHWKGILCSDYGVPQTRNRLFIFGAGPGEAIPPFPAPTHGPVPPLKPVPTIRNVLGEVRRHPNPANHDTSRHYQTPRSPISADQQAKTITTNGGIGNRHHSGLRPYTVRELARFQTFPLDYQFADVGLREQKRQVGNAVPPILAEVLYKSAIKSLKRTDASGSS